MNDRNHAILSASCCIISAPLNRLCIVFLLMCGTRKFRKIPPVPTQQWQTRTSTIGSVEYLLWLNIIERQCFLFSFFLLLLPPPPSPGVRLVILEERPLLKPRKKKNPLWRVRCSPGCEEPIILQSRHKGLLCFSHQRHTWVQHAVRKNGKT